MKTVINIKTDRATKEKAKQLAQELGFPLSTLVNSYLKHFVRTREVHFSVDPHMTPKLEKIIEEAERDFAQGKNISPLLSSPESVEQYLDTL